MGKTGPLDQPRRRYWEEDAAPKLQLLFSDLYGRQKHDAADGQGCDNIDKRFHGFSPYSNANQTSLFLLHL